jgi:hypothetical protein
LNRSPVLTHLDGVRREESLQMLQGWGLAARRPYATSVLDLAACR